jgi:hypothetical protein
MKRKGVPTSRSAVGIKGRIEWRNDEGKLHREKGPACEYPWGATTSSCNRPSSLPGDSVHLSIAAQPAITSRNALGSGGLLSTRST